MLPTVLKRYVEVLNRLSRALQRRKTHIVSFSGGIGSFVTAKMVVDRYGAENTILLFADTKMEDPDLYRFVDDCVEFLGCRLEVIADGRTPWQVFEDERLIGNSLMDPCSKILKRNILIDWLQSRFLPNECEVHIGIDFSEKHRLPPIVERMKPYRYRALMVEDEIMLSQDQKKEFCERFGIEVPHLYRLGFPHNNCGGMCVKAGLGQFKMLFEKLPDRYMEHEQTMEDIMSRNSNLKPFLRKRTKNNTSYLTLKQYREQHLEVGKAEEDVFDFGGCGCALD